MSSSTGFGGGGGGGGGGGVAVDLDNPDDLTEIQVNHGLGNEDVGAFLLRKSDKKNMLVEWWVVDANSVAFKFHLPPPSDVYRVVVVPT